jgi:hypothetical protein
MIHADSCVTNPVDQKWCMSAFREPRCLWLFITMTGKVGIGHHRVRWEKADWTGSEKNNIAKLSKINRCSAGVGSKIASSSVMSLKIHILASKLSFNPDLLERKSRARRNRR